MSGWRGSDGDLWDEAPCGLLVAGADGLVLRVNRTLCRWLGYDAAELAGRLRFSALMPMGARVFLQTHWTPLLQIQGSVSEVQLDLLHKDGHRVPMMLSAMRRERDGRLQDEIAVLAATDRKLYERELLAARAKAEAVAGELAQAQDKLRQAVEALSAQDRRKDEFLATLAHELRNPLAPIANVIALMKLRGARAQPAERELAILSRQAVQMTRLVDDLMNVARISQGKLDLRLDAVELVQALRFVAEEAAPAIQAAGQSLRVSLPEAPMWGRLDHARVTQIVANLLNNASKYSPAGAHLALTATREEGGQGGPDVAVIEVSDDGIGIAPDQLGRIFDMFSQLTPAMERAQGGLGIGLSLVKGLVELHGGQVAAHSDGPGKGSRFTVRMPLAAPLAPVAATARAPARATPGERAHVVLVDDNHDAAETLAAALDMLGYRVSVCHSAHEALAAMAQAPPRAAVLDIGLPDLNGYELARRIRGTPWGAGIVLVAATGWGQDTDKQAAREAGFDAHFTKPLDFISLDRELKSLLERR